MFPGRGCAFIYLFTFLLLFKGRGWRLTFFFSPSLHCTNDRKWPSRIRQAILGLFSDPKRNLYSSSGNRGSKTTSLFPHYGLLPPSIYLETCYTLSFFHTTAFSPVNYHWWFLMMKIFDFDDEIAPELALCFCIQINKNTKVKKKHFIIIINNNNNNRKHIKIKNKKDKSF